MAQNQSVGQSVWPGMETYLIQMIISYNAYHSI